jgi:hypothetical protein
VALTRRYALSGMSVRGDRRYDMLTGARDLTRCRIGPLPFVEKVEGDRRRHPAKEET